MSIVDKTTPILIGNLQVGESTEIPLKPTPPPDVNFKKSDAAEHHYKTGAQRDNRQGKGALHWLPWDAVFLVSRIYELGNKGRSKTGDGNDRNWENGMPIQDLCQSAMNHITAYISGDRTEAHLPQAVWNLLNAITMGIWVHMGWRDSSLNQLPNHRGPWKPGDSSPSPLSQLEIDWLKIKGIEKKA